MSFWWHKKSWTYAQQTLLSPLPLRPLDDYFIGSVVLAPNQGLQIWLRAVLYVVSYCLAARGHDHLARFYRCFSWDFRLGFQSTTHVDADLLEATDLQYITYYVYLFIAVSNLSLECKKSLAVFVG